jgi:ABC-type bacteriocin/lantibiotic exporter with double-glycine peptidase domain
VEVMTSQHYDMLFAIVLVCCPLMVLVLFMATCYIKTIAEEVCEIRTQHRLISIHALEIRKSLEKFSRDYESFENEDYAWKRNR